MANLDLTLRRVKGLQEGIRNLWDNVNRFRWSHEDYLRYRREHIFSTDNYKRLPMWAKENLRGYDAARYDLVWREMMFSYIVDGERITIDSAEWARVIGTIYEKETDGTFDPQSGKHVWKDDHSKLWG